MRALAEVARTAQAIVAECDKQKALLNDTLMQLKRSGVLVTAPDGIALTSAQHLQLAAGENLIATAGGSADIGAVRKFTVAAGEAISLFAHRLGMKLFAAQGKVEIQAQTGELNLASDKDTTISSVNGRVVISAKQEILFKCGGSYFKMTSTGIEDATHGDRTIKSASFSRQGPDGMPDDLPILPKPAPAECALRARQAGTPLSRF
jgi:type VI secretion system secreted protein VgrG